MVGAMAARLTRLGLTTADEVLTASDQELADVLSWGLAAGAATAATEGTSLGAGAMIRRLIKQAKVRRRG
jgi:hypothetical protein